MQGGDLTQEQFDKVLRLCDILGLEDFHIATEMLKENSWNLQKAMGVEQQDIPKQNIPSTKSIKPTKPSAEQPQQQPQQVQQQHYQNFDQPINYDQFINLQQQQQANEYQYQYLKYQQQFDKNQRVQQNKKSFNQGYVSIPLNKTKSTVKDTIQGKLGINSFVVQNYSRVRSEYQGQLLVRSGILLQRILEEKSLELQRCYNSIKKNEQNKKFITHLYKKYHSEINFTFGTFLLNLARSYLDHKYLLVYIHRSQYEQNKSITMLLNQREIANFINKNCVAYGMFDSSDDYQILHQYVQLKDLPAFVLFKFDKSKVKEKMVGVYPVLQEKAGCFIQWLANKIGVVVKKKQQKPEMTAAERQRIQLAHIMYEQNSEYEEMAKLYQMKRAKSMLRKQSIEMHEQQIEKHKKQYEQEPVFEPGVAIQIRFRLPMTGNSKMRTFKLDEKIERMFGYINCFGRDEFQQKLAKFDLTQTFPKLSLLDKMSLTIKEVFPDSDRENIIVQQL